METQTSHRNLALDSLRGFSTILIVVYHTSFVSGYTVAHADSIGAYIDRLNIGVAIFFVLSGFLIFRPFAHSLIHGSPLPKTRNYYLKRAARILPGYWLALFLLAGLDALTIVNTSGFIRNVFIVHSFTEHNVFTGIRQAWTLAVEMSFYVVVPAFAYVFVRQTRRRIASVSVATLLKALSALFLGAYAFRLFIHQIDFWFLNTAHIWLPSHMDTLALGMGLAVLVEAPASAKTLSKLKNFIANHTGSFVVCSVFVWLISANINMAIGLNRTEFHIDLLGHFLYGIASVLLVAPFCVDSQALLVKAVSFRLFTWLGTISYGVYLWHMAFLGGNFAEKYMPYTENDGQVLLRFLVVLPASIAIASLSYYVLERPIMRTVNRRFTLNKELRL
ncbi:MAG: acyltransferase [Actinobacteria bacterium]|nr:acyltransferase [Actinomycetota bacterium]